MPGHPEGTYHKAGLDDPRNKKNLFQNQELDDDLGINYYEFRYRNYDPQIGRFIQIDPLADKYVYNGTYVFSEDHVTTHVELEGLEKKSIHEVQAERRRHTVQSRREAAQHAQNRSALGLNEPLPRNAIDNVAEGRNGFDPTRPTIRNNKKGGSDSDRGGLFETSSQADGLSKDTKGRPDGDPVNIDMLTINLEKPDPKNIADWFGLAKDITSQVEDKKKKEAYSMLVAHFLD